LQESQVENWARCRNEDSKSSDYCRSVRHGNAMATAFAATGANIWVADASIDALSRCPGDWNVDTVDVREPEEMKALFGRIDESWGGLDALCANAGTPGPTALTENQPYAEFWDCLAVNLGGAFLSVANALLMMKRQYSGVVLFTSSTAGLFGFPYRALYAASKWALHGLMKTVAMEAGPYGIRANAIAPSCVEGSRIDAVIEREAAAKRTARDNVRRAYEAGTSLRRFAKAEDVAAMAVFLASDAAQMISGRVIAVDGHTENPDPKF
jgi:NAD(P)-dependent dehydrogenase (short-subunit alcohol dehydrogenase family)